MSNLCLKGRGIRARTEFLQQTDVGVQRLCAMIINSVLSD